MSQFVRCARCDRNCCPEQMWESGEGQLCFLCHDDDAATTPPTPSLPHRDTPSGQAEDDSDLEKWEQYADYQYQDVQFD